MEVELVSQDKKGGKLTFTIKNTSAALANSIRRSAIEEVPVMAIEDVEFRRNSSGLYDEIVAHRLGLVPLTTDLEGYTLPEKCACQGAGCAKCQLKLNLKAKGPSVVYASELKSKDPKVKPVYPEMPIVKLLKGQKLEFEATAVLGRGTNHAKWSSGIMFFKYLPSVKIGNVKNPQRVIDGTPQGVFELKSGKLTVNEEMLLTRDLAGSAEHASDGEITVEDNPNHIVFTVESWGQLECKEIIDAAVTELTAQLEEFEKAVQEK